MTREEFLTELRIVDDVWDDEPFTPNAQQLADYDADRRVLLAEKTAQIEQMDSELTELREWQKIIIGTVTDHEAVVRMAAVEYTKAAVNTWKELTARQATEIDGLREVLRRLRNEVSGLVYLHEQALREICGNTNISLTILRLNEADILLR